MESKVSIKTMKAIRFHDYGGPEKLVIEDAAIPEPKDNEVLVHINAVAVNPYDWKVRAGIYKQFVPVKFPTTPGIEAAGVVERVGPEVKNLKPGQAVYGNIQQSYAEYALAQANALYLKPTNLSFEEASAVPVGSETAYSSLFDLAHLKKGQRILIHGAAGSVGVFAVQLAKWKGAYVIGTASSSNIAFLKTLGADEVIDYNAKRFEEEAKEIDVVLDCIGGEIIDRSWQVLKKGGVLVSIAGQPSQEKAAKFGVKGLYRNSGISKEGLKDIQQLIAEGKLRPIIRQVLPLSKASQAQELSQKLHGRGKIVLTI